MPTYDCIIIGGGAAGLTATVFLGRALPAPSRVLLLEKLPRVGKKLLATGNGTCNISNVHAAPARYHGDTALAGAVLERFSPADTVDFFDSLGLACVRRTDGKYYPRAEQASAVLDCLRLELQTRGVEERCGTAVTAISRTANGITVKTADGVLHAKTVLVCTGGAAAPNLGGNTDGYALLTALGHTRTPLFPSIVQIRTDTAFVRAMQGIRVDGSVTIETPAASRCESGEILFTAYGLSGPAVMQASRLAADWERQKKGQCTATLDLFPDTDEKALFSILWKRRELPARTLEDFFTGLLNKRIGQTVIRAAGLPLSAPAATLDRAAVLTLTHTLKHWCFPVTGTQGFGGAQVTAGGIDTADFDSATLQSRRAPGVFAAGEILNVDGDCGGYNLQFAFSSAFVAANGILAYLGEEST